MVDTNDRALLLRGLLRPQAYPHLVGAIEHLETHISDVLLTGEYAYKLKKPLNLGFLNFSTVELRRACCEEELRLNRRLAPELYLAVVPIAGSFSDPRIGGDAPILDYAVRMRQFDQAGMLERVAGRGELTAAIIDSIAEQIAEFHSGLPPGADASGYGTAAEIAGPALQNFDQLQPLIASDAERGALRGLREWTEQKNEALASRFEARRQAGYVRECHGDLHLGNIVLVDGRVRIFDCIEFNPRLRWIDVMNEAAFLSMDLIQRGYSHLAYRFINRYLEHTGDYAGVDLLSYYMVYRALVRAKVAAMRAAQASVSADARRLLQEKCRAHIDLARQLTAQRRRVLFIMHGLSGSGKTVVSQAMLEAVGAIRVRSDVERKRLHGLGAAARSGSPLGQGIYVPSASQATYDRLTDLATALLMADYPVVVDAAFLKREQRERFERLAESQNAGFAILDIHAAEATLRRRIAERTEAGTDASEANLAVLEQQLAVREPLTAAEQTATHVFDTDRLSPAAVVDRAREITASIGGTGLVLA